MRLAAADPTPVGDLAEWLADTTDGLSAGARLGLRIEAVAAPPEDAVDEEGLDEEGLDEEGEAQRPQGASPTPRLCTPMSSDRSFYRPYGKMALLRMIS